MPLELNIGLFSVFPPEILLHIFQFLTFNDTTAIVSVSKSWLKIITSKDVWASRVEASTTGQTDPFTIIQNSVINKKIWTPYKDHYIYATDVVVTNGESMLIIEEGSLQGIKLNGQVWIQNLIHKSFIIFNSFCSI